MEKIIIDNLLEIRGILRTLADYKGQGIAKPKRLIELISFLKSIGIILEFSEKKIMKGGQKQNANANL